MVGDDGYSVDAEQLRAQAGIDQESARELRGAGDDVVSLSDSAASGALDSADLAGRLDYALELLRTVYRAHGDAVDALADGMGSAAENYEAAERTSAQAYEFAGSPLSGRMERV